MILIPSFHSLRKECLGLQPPFFVLNTKKNNGLQIISLTAYSSKTNKPLLLNKTHVSIKPSFLLKCVWKKKAPPPPPPRGGLIEDLQYAYVKAFNTST